MRARHLFDAGAAAAALAGVLMTAPAAAAQPQAAQAYELPEQALGDAIREVARRAGTNVIAPAELVTGLRAPALAGTFTPQEALRRILAGTGLSVEDVQGAFVIRSRDGDATTDADIIVTGTNIRGANPTSPLIRITREAIDRSGATSVERLMRTIPQNSQGGVNSENSLVALADQDPTDHGAGVNLRGLGQRATLVLLNGRRLAPSGGGGFVDISLIPVSLLQRVEILTDGASAIYGSDAVGGVINFILRDRLSGLESTLQAGSTTSGGGDQLLLSQAAGTGWSGGRALLGYEYRGENEIRASDRAFTIGLRPDTFLLPRERRHSILGLVEQELNTSLSVGATGTYGARKTARTYFNTTSPLPVGTDADAQSVSLGVELRYRLGAGNWLARLGGNYGLSLSDQRQSQPGGVELVNARDVRHEILEAAARLDGTVAHLPGGAFRVAIGAEARTEGYRDFFRSSTIARIGKRAERSVHSVFAELVAPIVSSANAVPGIERLQMSVAARYDRYDATGSTFDPRIGLAWSPLPGLELRGAYSTSFRAPLLSEVIGAYNVIYVPARFIYANPALAPAGLAAVLQGSNPAVGPERSRSWTFGGEYRPPFAPGLALTANYYSIRFTDRIALPTRVINVVGLPGLEPIVDRSPDAAALGALVKGAQLVLDFSGPGFTNGGASPEDVLVVLDARTNNTAVTVTRGLDLGLRYAFELGPNAFVLDANVSHILAFDERLTSASPIIAALDRPYRPLSWRGRGGLGWSRENGWAGSVFVNYSAGYSDDRKIVVRPVEAYETVDATLSYTFCGGPLRDTRVALFVENLFDKDPPLLVPDPGRTSGLGYDPVNASGRGRFVSLQIRRSW